MTAPVSDGWWVEQPMPDVTANCKVCARVWPFKDGGLFVVSPSGVAHHGDGGDTLCGHDATGDNWWWPL